MVKEIQIGGEKVTFKSSGALPIIYRQLTGSEFFRDIQRAGDMTDRTLDVAWVMYRHGNPDDKTEEVDWLERFEFGDLNNALLDILSMLTKETEEQSEAKKKEGQ